MCFWSLKILERAPTGWHTSFNPNLAQTWFFLITILYLLQSVETRPLFSLRWSLPPTLGCIPKQPNSKDTMRDGCQHHRGQTPTMGKGSNQENSDASYHPKCSPEHHSSHQPVQPGGFSAGLFPFHSPLPWEPILMLLPMQRD